MGKLKAAGIYDKYELIAKTAEQFVTLSLRLPPTDDGGEPFQVDEDDIETVLADETGCVVQFQDSMSFCNARVYFPIHT